VSPAAGPDQTSTRLLTLLGGRLRADDAPARLLGVEHEFSLSDGEQPVDFRRLIHSLPVAGLRLDPGDVNAYRLPNGVALTCDDAEAEVALPPLALHPGFSAALDTWSATAKHGLEALLPSGISPSGYSTHVSAAMPARLNEEATRLYAATFAPALMLLADRRDAYGIYLRPRPGRLEFCSDYVEGSRLRAVATFVAGSVRAIAARLSRDEASPQLLPTLEVSTRPAQERYGLYVGRRAFGGDLYADGRNALLTRRSGGTISAQEQLGLAWSAARSTLTTVTAPAELLLVDRLVAGDLPLPVESDLPPLPAEAEPDATVFGALTAPRLRGAVSITATIATWDFTVFEASAGEHRLYICIPRPYLATFLAGLDSGRLDALITEALQRPARNRVLEDRLQTREPAIWDRIGRTRDLLPPERSTSGAVVQTSDDSEREGKDQLALIPPPPRTAEGASSASSSWPFYIMLLVLGLAGAALGYLFTRDDSGDEVSAVTNPTPTVVRTVAVSPTAQATTTVTVVATTAATTAATATATTAPPTATTAAVAVAPTSPPPPPPTATPLPPTATPIPNLVAGVGPIAAVFVPASQTTTYIVLNTGAGLAYAWSGPDCGSSTGATTNGFAWNHPHPPCDPSTQHANITVQVLITDGNNRVRCIYTGAATGNGPPCVPF
jgi:hypothetical protein